MCIPYPKTCSGRSTKRYGKNLSSSLRVRVPCTTKSTCSVLIKNCVNPLCYTHDCVTDLAALIDCKIHFYYHVGYIFSQRFKVLKLFWQQPFALPTYRIFWYYCTSVKPQFQHASILWNYIRPSYTDVSKLKRNQCKLIYYYYYHHHYHLLYTGYLYLYSWDKLCPSRIQCCSYSVVTIHGAYILSFSVESIVLLH